MDPNNNEQGEVEPEDLEPLEAWEDDTSSALGDLAEAADDANAALDDLASAADDATYAPATAARAARAGSAPRDADGRIDSDLACIGCGYNLRSQLPGGDCPECGVPVAESLRSDRLRYANLGWLRELHRGMFWLITATFGSLGIAAVAGGFIGFLPAVSQPAYPNPVLEVIAAEALSLPETILLVVATLASSGLYIHAYWRLTTAEPDAKHDPATRALARWAMLPAYALSVVTTAMSVILEPTVLIAAGVLDLIIAAGTAFGFYALMLYLRSLAKRLPSQQLARHTSIVLWGIVISVAVILVVVVIALAVGLQGAARPTVMGIIALGACPGGLAFAVFAIWYVVLLFVYRSRLGKAITSNRRTRRPGPIDTQQIPGA